VARRRRWNALPYLLVLPSLVLIVLIEVYPLAVALVESLHDGTLLHEGSFVGIQNYRELWQLDEFRHALVFSALFATGNVVGSYVLGLAFALLLNRRDLGGRGFFRFALLLPWIMPSIVSITSWRWLIADQSGLLNVALQLIGLGPVYFLSSDYLAMLSVTVIKIWRSFPIMMIACLAVLNRIDGDLYEAATVDGAGRWQSFRFVTFPELLRTSVILWILTAIWSVNDFDTPWLLTQGGPANATGNLIVLAYKYTFTVNDVGRGTAMTFYALAVLLLGVILLVREPAEGL
jgi:multiple sugar transport system permease protein